MTKNDAMETESKALSKWSRFSRLQGGNSMVGVLVATAIVLLMMVVLFLKTVPGISKSTGPGRKDHLGKTIPGAIKADAQDDVCRSNLHQIRMSIETQEAVDPDGGFPASLKSLHLPLDMLKCPLGGTYKYDPKTGTVHCDHPGHESF